MNGGSIYSRQFISLLLANLFFWLSVNVFLPVLPLYYHHLGMDDNEVGLAVGAYSVGAIACRVFAGKATDRYGSTPVISIGIIISTIGIAAYYVSGSFITATLSRLVHGAGITGFAAASMTMASLMYEKEYATEVLSVLTLSTMIGVGIAASSAYGLYEYGGIGAVILVGAVATLLSLLLFPKKPHLKIKAVKSQSLPLKKVITHPGVYVPTFSLAAVNLCFGSVMTFFPLLMLSQGMNQFSLFYIAYSIAVIFSRMWVGKLCCWLTPERLAMYIMILFGGTMVLTGQISGRWIGVLCGAGVGIGYGLAYPTLATIITTCTQPANRGTAFGFFAMAVDSGLAVGAIGMGFVAGTWGYPAVFTAAGMYTLVYTILYRFWLKPKMDGCLAAHPTGKAITDGLSG
ncbi:Hypothetical protein LUCI_4002 [Lucifera butyrica]|uniref:Major facilitator superfamily (MFS) profile domain-containing protein n=1 Tax=Lucifera butyrica TaxID=1351585 RepID=A0A498RB64_9FIRM|nr:Hypothetical protein LUCI_4002 [Lucifera butyrica]